LIVIMEEFTMSVNKENILYNERFPLSNKYDPGWVLDNSMGLNALWLTEWLCEAIDLKPGMRVLDLGCGRAISSVFLAKEFGVQVWAYDLWIEATDNWNRIKQQGLDNKIYPIHGDARNMPFAEGFFDAIISVDSYIYFGTDDLYLYYLQKFLTPGGTLGIVMPGLMKDFKDGIPAHLKDFWGQDCWSWHTVDWWNKLWERTGLVDIKVADTMPEGCITYVKWKEAQDKAGKNPWPQDTAILKKDAGEYVGFIRLVANRR
jgi:cyclopropane fatty-acyl-phospholipid synthase-like methyltransferase